MRNAITRRCSAFTLIELLAVMTIIGVLSALVAVPAATIMSSMALAQGAQMLRDQLVVARQAALSLNGPVEVRFYQYGDPQTPGESLTSPATGKYRAMQIFKISDSGSASPLGKIQRFPGAVILDSGDTLSPILAKSTSSAGDTLGFPLPTVGTSYNCVSFRFRPDGSASLLPASERWFLTAHLSTLGDKLSGSSMPANFVTVQIGSMNGHVKIYTPGI